MQNNMPLVSVIIPVFNAEKTIERTIESIIKQTYTNWELILIDDCSSDDSHNICLQYKKRFPTKIIIEKLSTNHGSAFCRNVGLKKCSGVFFVHFDADDLIEPFCLEQRVLFLINNPSIDYATFPGETVTIGNDNKVIPTSRKWGVIPKKCSTLEAFLSVRYPFSVWNNVYRTSSFRDYFWDEKVKIYTDFSYIVPVIINNKKHAYVTEAKIDYHYVSGVSGAMTSNFVSDSKFISTIYLFSKTFNSLLDISNSKTYIKSFKRFFIYHYGKIVISGTKKQEKDFYSFFKKYYHYFFRLFLCHLLLLLPFSKIKRIRKFIFYSFFLISL